MGGFQRHPGRRAARSAKRADPGPTYPGLVFISEAGVHGSRIASLALGVRDDNPRGFPDAICALPQRERKQAARVASHQLDRKQRLELDNVPEFSSLAA